MREIKGDLWDVAEALQADAVVITTNGFVKKNGEAVMGRGVALEAKQRWGDLPRLLGASIRKFGNKLHAFTLELPNGTSQTIITFPVKTNWWEKADPELIYHSALNLKVWAEHLSYNIKCIVLPRPGCGNGGLEWERVKPILEKWLGDDRFVVVHKEIGRAHV